MKLHKKIKKKPLKKQNFWTLRFLDFLKCFRVLMSCIVSAASYRTTIDLFYDGTNHTINYVDENSVLYA